MIEINKNIIFILLLKQYNLENIPNFFQSPTTVNLSKILLFLENN
jgi:hypothetical protein